MNDFPNLDVLEGRQVAFPGVEGSVTYEDMRVSSSHSEVGGALLFYGPGNPDPLAVLTFHLEGLVACSASSEPMGSADQVMQTQVMLDSWTDQATSGSPISLRVTLGPPPTEGNAFLTTILNHATKEWVALPPPYALVNAEEGSLSPAILDPEPIPEHFAWYGRSEPSYLIGCRVEGPTIARNTPRTVFKIVGGVGVVKLSTTTKAVIGFRSCLVSIDNTPEALNALSALASLGHKTTLMWEEDHLVVVRGGVDSTFVIALDESHIETIMHGLGPDPRRGY